MEAEELGRQALAAIDKVLAGKPHADGHALSEATKNVALFRDEVIARQHHPPQMKERRDLEHVNAVISVVLAVHFPLGDIPWHELEGARSWLAELLPTRA